MANILIACEFSGTVREAFAAKGHYAMSCDLLPTERDLHPGGLSAHYEGRIEHLLNDKRLHWDLMIAHPPCTYLTNSGVHLLYKGDTQKRFNRWLSMEYAAAFFCELKNANISRICIENPIPHKHSRKIIGNYTQLIQPWMFGHPERKATCLWLKNLPKLIPTKDVKAEMLALPKNKQNRIYNIRPSKDRWKIRSRFFQGIADAMADQWGGLL